MKGVKSKFEIRCSLVGGGIVVYGRCIRCVARELEVVVERPAIDGESPVPTREPRRCML